MDTYNIRVEVLDNNGKIILDDDGHKRPDIRFDYQFFKDDAESSLRQLAKTLKAWMPNYNISLYASLPNSISGSWTEMFSLYVNENRFIKY